MNVECQEIELLDLMRRIAKKWWLIVILVTISAVTSYYVTKMRITPIYKATTTIFIGKESSSITDISLADLEIGNQLVTDYRELIKTNLVAKEVIEKLALKVTPVDLNKFLMVQTVKGSRFMHISYKDPSPELAVKIVDKVSEVMKEKAETIVGAKNVHIVDYAELPHKPVSPNLFLNVAVAAVLGFITAIIIIVLDTMLDTAVHKEEEIEKEIGLPVLGIIPKFKGVV